MAPLEIRRSVRAEGGATRGERKRTSAASAAVAAASASVATILSGGSQRTHPARRTAGARTRTTAIAVKTAPEALALRAREDAAGRLARSRKRPVKAATVGRANIV